MGPATASELVRRSVMIKDAYKDSSVARPCFLLGNNRRRLKERSEGLCLRSASTLDDFSPASRRIAPLKSI